MARLETGQRVFANLTADETNAILARAVLRGKGLELPEAESMTRVDYRVNRKNRSFVGARVEVWLK